MDVDAAVQSQIRNIEATYDKPLDHWFAVIDASGLAKHNQVVAMLKADHGLAHGAAHRISLLSRQRHDAGVAQAPDPADAPYAGAKARLRPLHDALSPRSRRLAPSASSRRRAT
jgi:FAD/FMN-containing dehydrogenase